MCSKTVNPFSDGADKLSGALARFQHAADELWRAIDNCTSTLQKIDVEDYPDPFKTLGFLRVAVYHYCGTFSDSQAAVARRTGPSKKALEHLQSHVDSSAMKYGLNRLPTELLSWIFLDATSRLKSTVALSHVSKQFRPIVNRSPAIWQRIRLSSSWDREQILAIAERSAFRSFKAVIWPQEDVNGKELDSDTAIFSFHSRLEELSIYCLSMEDAEEVRRRLGFLHFPSLQVLSSRKSEILAFQHPQQTFEVPSLRILDVDFLPHNSMARNLVELHLNLWMVSLASLLDFLSSTSVLEDLNISVLFIDNGAEQEMLDHKPVRLFIDNGAEQEMFDYKPVRQPGLVKLCLGMRGCLISSASIVARKIHSSSLRTLVLRCDDCEVGTTSDGPFQNILQSNPSFTKLELSGFTSIDLCHIPPQVEVLLLDVRGFSYFNCAGTVSSHQIRLIRFHEAEEPLVQDRVYDIRQVLLDSGLNAVQFEFQNRRRFRNGLFNLDDAHRAFLDNGDDDYMDDDFD